MPRAGGLIAGLSIAAVIATSFAAPGRAAPAAGPPARDDAQPLTGILERIRQDVGYYEVRAARWRHEIDPDSTDDPDPGSVADPAACPTSELDLDVTVVEARLQTVITESASGDIGLSVPFFGKEGSADANVMRNDTQTETVTLGRHFHYDPDQLKRYADSDDFAKLEKAHAAYATNPTIDDDGAKTNPVLPIADTLIKLRRNMTAAAGKLPCFDWEDKLAKPGSITFEFLVQHAGDGTIGFNFWILSAKAEAKVDHTMTNAITISFAPHHPGTSAPGTSLSAAAGATVSSAASVMPR